MIAAHAERADDPHAALAAIRVVGADAFAPYLLGDAVFHPQDAAAVAQSFAVFPPPADPPAPPPAGPAEPWLVAWRDWATTTLLTRFAGTDDALADLGPSGALAQRPAGAPELEPDATSAAAGPGSRAVTEDPGSRTAESAADRPADEPAAPGTPWQAWSVRMGQLSPLALPGLDGPVHAAARAAPLALARGATRAVLRRDYPTAARIARWLALLGAEGRPLPLDPVPLVEHLRLYGGGPRLALDVAIAGRLLGVENA